MSNEKCREKILTNIAICDIIIKVCDNVSQNQIFAETIAFLIILVYNIIR